MAGGRQRPYLDSRRLESGRRIQRGGFPRRLIRLVYIGYKQPADRPALGTPADPEEGTPAEEGLLTEELQSQLNGWLLNLVGSMGADSNYPEDNDTTITGEWKLLTDRSALDKAIAEAQALDLSQYTEETAKRRPTPWPPRRRCP